MGRTGIRRFSQTMKYINTCERFGEISKRNGCGKKEENVDSLSLDLYKMII
jgi:hypothetical protein